MKTHLTRWLAAIYYIWKYCSSFSLLPPIILTAIQNTITTISINVDLLADCYDFKRLRQSPTVVGSKVHVTAFVFFIFFYLHLLFFSRTFTFDGTCDIHVIYFSLYIWFTFTFYMSHVMTHWLTRYDSHLTHTFSSLWLVVPVTIFLILLCLPMTFHYF